MTLRRTALPLILLVLCLLVVVPSSFGQTEAATLSGLITDPQGKVVPDVAVEVTNVDTNVSVHQTTNNLGLYVVVGLKPGHYRVSVTKEGFRRIDLVDLVLNVQDVLSRNVQLQLGSVSSSITVTADASSVNATDAAVGTIIDRQFVDNIPLNGRSFESLIQLIPGVTAVPGASNGTTGEFSVNGQRTETNYYTVDGVSANTGMATLSYSNGGTPAATAVGTSQALVSVDDLQEFRISTSTYSAEYGRSPGGQLSFQTRSGTNEWHGTVYEYFRNGVLDANNWFNDTSDLPKPAERQNDFGGTLGGPVRIPGLYNGKDKTFFFFSYEGLRLTIPQAATTTEVPDMMLRQSAPTAMQPIVNAFPIPNGADQGNSLALFTGSYSSPSSVDSYSIRLDHSFGQKLTIFGRYADAPSQSVNRYVPYDLANLITQSYDTKTVTVGAASVLSNQLVNEFRFNYTNSSNRQIYSTDNFGGATPITLSQTTSGTTIPQGSAFVSYLYFGTLPHVDLFNTNIPQHQWNITDSLTRTFGAHTLKFGVDYRKLIGTYGLDLLDEFLYFSPTSVLTNAADLAYVEYFGSSKTGLSTNFSAFVQDEWKTTSRLNLSLGLRWDLNPAPRAAHNPQPYTLDQITDLATAELAPAGTPLYHNDYRGFAPRVGVAYRLGSTTGKQTVLRGGFGVFYDLGSFGALNGISAGIGNGSLATYSNAAFPLPPAQQIPPPPSTASPYTTTVSAVDPHLRLPYSFQWNVAIEQELGSAQAITLSYIGAGGRKLLSGEYDNLAGINPNFALGNGLLLTTGRSTSNYDAMQLQFQRRLSRGLQILASYTWSHSIDDLSSNKNIYDYLLRGSSDFDVRHNFNAALTYDLPGGYSSPVLRGVLGHWEVDLREFARSALPVDIYYGYAVIGNGQTVLTRPDLVAGVPVYISDPSAPGGRRVNPDAFAAPSGQLGDAPRNFVRGFDLWQTDLALRREFPIHERLKLQFRAESFNLFNHPIFGSIDNNLSDGPTLFGRATSTLNSSLGGLNPLYQVGGPRSLQLALKVIF